MSKMNKSELYELCKTLQEDNKKLQFDMNCMEEENNKNINIIEELWGKDIDKLHKELKESNEERHKYYERYNYYRDENIDLKEENEKYKTEILKLNQQIIKYKNKIDSDYKLREPTKKLINNLYMKISELES